MDSETVAHLNSGLSTRILTPRDEGCSNYSGCGAWDAYGSHARRSGQAEKNASLKTIHRIGRHANPHPYVAKVCRGRSGERDLDRVARKRNCRISRAVGAGSERRAEEKS